MEINNIPKIAVNTATDSHHGVVLFGSAYWGGMMQWVKGLMLSEGKITEADLRLLHLTDSPEEAVEIVVNSQDSLRKLDKTVPDEYELR